MKAKITIKKLNPDYDKELTWHTVCFTANPKQGYAHNTDFRFCTIYRQAPKSSFQKIE